MTLERSTFLPNLSFLSVSTWSNWPVRTTWILCDSGRANQSTERSLPPHRESHAKNIANSQKTNTILSYIPKKGAYILNTFSFQIKLRIWIRIFFLFSCPPNTTKEVCPQHETKLDVRTEDRGFVLTDSRLPSCLKGPRTGPGTSCSTSTC